MKDWISMCIESGFNYMISVIRYFSYHPKFDYPGIGDVTQGWKRPKKRQVKNEKNKSENRQVRFIYLKLNQLFCIQINLLRLSVNKKVFYPFSTYTHLKINLRNLPNYTKNSLKFFLYQIEKGKNKSENRQVRFIYLN